MEVSAIQLKNKLEEIWPRLGRNNAFKPWDRRYYLPTVQEVQSELMPAIEQAVIEILGQKIKIKDLHNVGEVFDCDDFAALTVALAKLYVKLKGYGSPWALGRASGFQFRGMSILHSLNEVFTQDDGPYFLDYEDRGRLWKGDPKNDSLFFLDT